MNIRLTPRLFVENRLTKDSSVSVSDDQAHYLQHVMRLRTGDVVRLFNAQDGEWRAAIGNISKKAVEVAVHEQTRPAKPEPDLWLCCAPIKKAHFDYMIEKATELGVGAIHPILTSRTQIREINTDRCRAMAIEAAEQSERLSIPDIHAAVSLKDLADKWPKDRLMIVCAEMGDAAPAYTAFHAHKNNSAKAGVIIGPEGGFTDEEFNMLRQVSNAVFIRLGPRILRADTAAISALSLWQGLCGDWASDNTTAGQLN